jgi:serine/threonine protein kinase
VHEFGDDGGRHYIVTDSYVEGHTVREMLTGGPLGAAQAVDLLRQAALALETAHRADIVHRDIKPEN